MPLGRYVHHDPRSRSYPFKGDAIATAKHQRYIPVLDQGSLGSCTGNAVVGALGTGDFYATIPSTVSLNEPLAVKIYSEATAIDNVPGKYPTQDTGSTGLAVTKVAQSMGFISGYQHTFSTQDLLAALTIKPVIIGVNWYEGFYDPDEYGRVAITGDVVGGHEFVLDEINVENRYVGATNSWGWAWGNAGRFTFTFGDLDRLLNEQGDGTVFVENTMPVPVPISADRTLYDATNVWANKYHATRGATRVANALKQWYTDKSLP